MESKEQGLTLQLRVKPRRMLVRQASGDTESRSEA
jgi:hypothetical protein